MLLHTLQTLSRSRRPCPSSTAAPRRGRNGLGLRSVTDSINTHVSGLYFGVPERTWAMLKPLNPSYSPSLLAVERAEMTVIKFGMKRGDTDRTEQHCTAFQGFYLLDHVPTEHMAEVEDLLKAWLRNEGLLFEGLHENRRVERHGADRGGDAGGLREGGGEDAAADKAGGRQEAQAAGRRRVCEGGGGESAAGGGKSYARS